MFGLDVAEVHQFDVPVGLFGDHEIVRTYVPLHNAVVVQLGECPDHLVEDGGHVGFSQTLLLSQNQVEQGEPVDELDDQVETLLVFKLFEDPDDVGVVQVDQQFDLFQELVDVLDPQFGHDFAESHDLGVVP